MQAKYEHQRMCKLKVALSYVNGVCEKHAMTNAQSWCRCNAIELK